MANKTRGLRNRTFKTPADLKIFMREEERSRKHNLAEGRNEEARRLISTMPKPYLNLLNRVRNNVLDRLRRTYPEADGNRLKRVLTDSVNDLLYEKGTNWLDNPNECRKIIFDRVNRRLEKKQI